MGISIDDDFHAELARPMCVHVVEIEPLWLSIDLHRDVTLLGSVEDVLEVDFHQRSLSDAGSCLQPPTL
jgi:hypothetical protein